MKLLDFQEKIKENLGFFLRSLESSLSELVKAHELGASTESIEYKIEVTIEKLQENLRKARNFSEIPLSLERNTDRYSLRISPKFIELRYHDGTEWKESKYLY